jgi:hypothetical protein
MLALVRFSIALAAVLALTPALAAEMRTYRFAPDGSLPYNLSLGESGGPVIGLAADVNGTFKVLLDLAAGKGTLVELNDQLVNVHERMMTESGFVLTAAPSIQGERIIPSWLPTYQPPLEGTLTMEGDELVLSFNGQKPAPNGMGFATITSFVIRMSGENATFSMDVPVFDAYPTVTNAAAVLVPEPQAMALAALGGAFGAGLAVRRRYRAGGNDVIADSRKFA